jgi:sugar phosphate isomerase/epimerase
VWWDPGLETEIARAGAGGRLACYQVSDWNLPIAPDALLSRGMMGDGYIDFDTIGRWVSEAGYTGDVEVEIFNEDIWAADGHEVIATLVDRYLDLVAPSLLPTTNHENPAPSADSDTLIPQ